MVNRSALRYPRKLKFAKRSHATVERMRELEEICDVTFAVGGKKFPAHRARVSASSPVTHKLLTNGMKESTQKEVAISEVSSDTWRRAMDFVYYKDIEIPTFADEISLLECANRFQFENLESSIDSFIAERLDTNNCFHILVASDCGVESTKKKAMDMIAANFQDVSRSNAIAVLNMEMMVEIASNDSLLIKSELDVLHFIFRWLLKNGHCMDEGLQAAYDNEQPDEDGSIANLSQSITKEEVRTLDSNICLKLFNLADLKEGITLSRSANLGSLEKSLSINSSHRANISHANPDSE